MKLNLKGLLDQIYVVHFEPLKERKSRIIDSLEKIDNVQTTFIIMNEETDDHVRKSYNDNFSLDRKIRDITHQELAISISHLKIYVDILEKKYKKCLVLEDDAILDEQFFDKIVTAIEESNDYDFTFLSSCCNLRAPLTKKGLLQESSTSRSVCGYIVNSNNLQKVKSACHPFIDVIDFQLNHIREALNLKYSWSEPPIITQGSEKIFSSNMDKVRIRK